ncbi:MAG: YHS domain-containing protein [Dehalococcoidia bacterium]|nr:YHS domain-containing protein [Dehalococcoidia bacterium]
MFEWLRKRRAEEPTSVVDPVCGMSIAPARAAATRTVGTRTVYLCSPACTDKFDRDPSAFTATAPSSSHQEEKHGHRHGGGGGCC